MSKHVDIEAAKRYFGKSVVKKEFEGHKKAVHALDWSCDGNRLASASLDRTIRVWSISTSHPSDHPPSSELSGHTLGVHGVSFHPKDADILASASSDKTLRIWDVRAKRQTNMVSTKGQNINISWSRCGTFFASATNKDWFSVYDTRTMTCIKEVEFKRGVNEFVWDRTSEHVLFSTGLGTVEIYTPDMKAVSTIRGHSGHIYCIDMDSSCRYLAAGGTDSFVTLWDLWEMACVSDIPTTESNVRGLSFSHCGQFLGIGSEDQKLDIVDWRSAEIVHSIKVEDTMNALVWNPKKYLLAYTADEKPSSRKAGIVSIFGFKK